MLNTRYTRSLTSLNGDIHADEGVCLDLTLVLGSTRSCGEASVVLCAHTHHRTIGSGWGSRLLFLYTVITRRADTTQLPNVNHILPN